VSPALWAGILTALALAAIFTARPVLYWLADRYRWKREHGRKHR
jgi:hypothetical protein